MLFTAQAQPVSDTVAQDVVVYDTIVTKHIVKRVVKAGTVLPGPVRKSTKPFYVVDQRSKYAATIHPEELKKHLSILASDEFEGRETTLPGQKKAAAYIADYFKELEIPAIVNDTSYYQPIPFTSEGWEKVDIVVDKKKYAFMKDLYCFNRTNRNRPVVKADEFVFLGFGIDDEKYSDYKKAKVKNKVILIYQGEPMDKDSISYITGTKELSEWTNNYRKKLRAAKKHGVKTVLLIEPKVPFFVNRYKQFLIERSIRVADAKARRSSYANSMYISTKTAKALIGKKLSQIAKTREKIRKKGKPKSLRVKRDFVIHQRKNKLDVSSENVLGYIEGSDTKLKEELVIISAHYDHLGKRGEDVFNGADDNGSGTSALLEIAEAFMLAKKNGHGPRRSVLIMMMTGEEKGLLGSAYYVNNPLFPLEKTVADINIDMIGREDKRHENNGNYVYVIGSDRLSTQLHEINEQANSKYVNLELDYKYNEKDDPNRYYYRSDHYNFAEKGIPSIFYFSGTHKDYHRPTDTVDKINFKKVAATARLAFLSAWEIANRADRIVVDVEQEK